MIIAKTHRYARRTPLFGRWRHIFLKILILLGNTFVWLTLSMTELITSINQNEELPLLRNTVMKRLLSLAVVCVILALCFMSTSTAQAGNQNSGWGGGYGVPKSSGGWGGNSFPYPTGNCYPGGHCTPQYPQPYPQPYPMPYPQPYPTGGCHTPTYPMPTPFPYPPQTQQYPTPSPMPYPTPSPMPYPQGGGWGGYGGNGGVNLKSAQSSPFNMFK